VTHRSALYVGAFLAAAGVVMLVGTTNAAAGGTITDLLRLWPLAVVAIGVGLLLRRTRVARAGILVAAIVPGLLVGGVVTASPDLDVVCDRTAPARSAVHDGVLSGPADVRIDLACGSTTVRTVAGSAWHVATVDLGDQTAVIDAGGDRLHVASDDGRRRLGFGRGGDDWAIDLPTAAALDLDARVDAGRGSFDLAGARIGDLSVEVNAGAARVDLSDASVERLSLAVHAGRGRLVLPATGDIRGRLEVAAGSLELCRPTDLALRISGELTLADSTFNGLVRVGDVWQTPDYPSATHRADLTVHAAAGSVVVDPQGDCK
jgi:hypothetical protein